MGGRGTLTRRFLASEISRAEGGDATGDLQRKTESEIQDLVYEDMEKKFKTQIKGEGDLGDVFAETNKPLQVPMRPEHESLMIPNPLDTPNYLPIDSTDTSGVRGVSLRLADNPKAREILQSNQFDLADPSLDVLDSMQSDLYFSREGGFKQISLGNVGVLSANSMALEDVDVENIPKNIDISLRPDVREVIVIGKEVGDGQEGVGGFRGGPGKVMETLDGQVFVEKSLEDARKEEMNLLERFLTDESLYDFVLGYIRLFPFFVFGIFFLQASSELKECQKNILEVDEQNMKALKELRRNARAIQASSRLPK